MPDVRFFAPIGVSLGFWAGCARDFECSVTLSDTVGTVAEVAWQTESAADSWVVFGVDGQTNLQSPIVQDETTHHHTLFGVPSNRDLEYVAYVEQGDNVRTCAGAIRTDSLPSGIPRYDLSVNQTDESDAPWVAIANAGNDRGQPVVVNRAGETVWWSSRQEGIVVTQLEPMEGGVRFLEQDLHREDPTASAIVTMDWLGQQEERIEISGAHHRFVSLDDGSMVALAVDVRDWTDPETGEDLQVVGDRLIAVSPEGDQEEIFSTWDVLEVTTDGFGGFYGDELDWTHGNSIWVDPTGETLLLTLGHLDSVLEIDRSTGALIRQIDAQSHVITEGTTEFGFPHDARWTDDGTLLLMTTDVFSFGVEYDIDAEAGSISEIRRIGDDVEIYAAALGEVQPMEHGGHLISYGMGGAIRELNQAGEVVWELWGKPGNDRLGSIRPFHSFAVSDDD